LESKKVFVLLHSQIERGQLVTTQKPSTRKRNFILIENKICELKSFAYLCTPNRKQGWQTARKGADKTAHTVTLIECSTRSLNDGNRQNSKCLIGFG
jgi:hypothetical protein